MKWPELGCFFKKIIIYQDADRISRSEQIRIWNTVFLIPTEKYLLPLLFTYESSTFEHLSFFCCMQREIQNWLLKNQSKGEHSQTALCVGIKCTGIYRKYKIWRLYIRAGCTTRSGSWHERESRTWTKRSRPAGRFRPGWIWAMAPRTSPCQGLPFSERVNNSIANVLFLDITSV